MENRIETPRRLRELQGRVPGGLDRPSGMPRPEDDEYRMPEPRMPFVSFRFVGSDEQAYGIILRRSDRTLDLGVFAPNHRTIQQKDGVRHASDPDNVRLAEHLPGIWEELPEIVALHDRVAWCEENVAALIELAGEQQGKKKGQRPAESESTETK